MINCKTFILPIVISLVYKHRHLLFCWLHWIGSLEWKWSSNPLNVLPTITPKLLPSPSVLHYLVLISEGELNRANSNNITPWQAVFISAIKWHHLTVWSDWWPSKPQVNEPSGFSPAIVWQPSGFRMNFIYLSTSNLFQISSSLLHVLF